MPRIREDRDCGSTKATGGKGGPRIVSCVPALGLPLSSRLGASPGNQGNFHIPWTSSPHFSPPFELISVEITQHTSAIAKQAGRGMLPEHTFDTKPCRKGGAVSPASSSGLLPIASVPETQMSPSPSHRASVKALGSLASVMFEVLPGSQ